MNFEYVIAKNIVNGNVILVNVLKILKVKKVLQI